MTINTHAHTLGVIGSSGGSALAAASKCLKEADIKQSWAVLTDRPCGLANWALNEEYTVSTIHYEGAEQFSLRAYDFFIGINVHQILLFYTRHITCPLINKLHVSNIHPSLLPDFPGLNAVRRAYSAGRSTIGASLHLVDQYLDSGKLIMQVSSTLPPDSTLPDAERISFIQKVWLTLVWQQQASLPNMAMCTKVIDAFGRFKASLGCNAITISSIP
jgi:phosphoribosylglycinamide formyltransferase 1